MLVALHGFTETDMAWLELFEPTGLELACPLLPGHGWAPCPEETSIASTAAELSRRYAAQGPVDLLGYSMGGRVACRWAVDHPETVRRLILISCRPGIECSEWRASRIARDEGLAEILEEDGIGTFVAWWEAQAVLTPFRPLTRQVRETLRSRRLNQDPHGLAAALRRLGQGSMEPLWQHLPELSMPTLLIAGSADTDFLADMRRMQELMPQAELMVIEQCGHAIHRECPRQLLQACVGFLAG